MVMKEAFDANYALTDDQRKEPAPCIACKNRLDLPCEGCDHWEAKKAATQSKKLIASAVGTLDSPTQLRHRIVEAIMAKQHAIEEEMDSLYMDHPDWEPKASMVEGLKMAVEIARKTE